MEFLGYLVFNNSNFWISLFLMPVANGVLTYFIIRKLDIQDKLIVSIFLFLPSFSVYSSIFLKEAFSIFFSTAFIGLWFSSISKSKMSFIFELLKLVLLLPLFAFRPLISVFLLIFNVSYLLFSYFERNDININRFYLSNLFEKNKISYIILIFTFFCILTATLLFKVIETSLAYFPAIQGNFDRLDWVKWNTRIDYFNTLWWSIPFSIIGPLPIEILSNKFMPILFIEGCFIFISSIYLISYLKTVIINDSNHFYIHWYALFFIPLILFLIIVNSPMSVVNPLASIRYRANFELLLTVLPFLLIVRFKKKYEN
jgi:hypothetical protein